MIKPNTMKKRACKKQMNYLLKNSNALCYVDVQDILDKEYYIMMDGYTLYAFKDEPVGTLFKDSPSDIQAKGYPRINDMIHKYISDKKCIKDIQLPSYEEVCKYIKQYKNDNPKCGDIFNKVKYGNEYIHYDCKKLKEVYEVLGVLECKVYGLGVIKPMVLVADDDFALLCSIRHYGKEDD